MDQMGIAGEDAKGNLRRWAPQRRAQGKAAMVSHRDQPSLHLNKVLNIRTVDPDVARPQPFRSPTGDRDDMACWSRDGFAGHK